MNGQRPMRTTWPARDMPWIALDWAAAAVLLALSVRSATANQANFGLPGWLTLAAAVGAAAPVAVRRLWPLGAFAVILGANTLVTAAGVSGNPAVMVALAIYPVAVAQAPRRSVPMAAVAVAVSAAAEAVGMLAGPHPPGWQVRFDVIAAASAIIPAAWALGAARRAQLGYAAHTAQQATSRAVADERLRIARELHDVITHSMSLITVKASVANYLIDSRPDEVHDALTVIEDTGRRALDEMRRMLGVLRAGGDGTAPLPSDTSAGLGPAPGLADLARLAEHAAEAGVNVDLVVDQAPGLPDGVALAAYRIVQEALTNVVKHAAPTRCRVQVGRTGHDVLIDVTDTGNVRRTQHAAVGGHGIVGMRERVTLFGGEFAAGPDPGGGFRVTARLPLAAATAQPDGSPPR